MTISVEIRLVWLHTVVIYEFTHTRCNIIKLRIGSDKSINSHVYDKHMLMIRCTRDKEQTNLQFVRYHWRFYHNAGGSWTHDHVLTWKKNIKLILFYIRQRQLRFYLPQPEIHNFSRHNHHKHPKLTFLVYSQDNFYEGESKSLCPYFFQP
jgi:hypothetical protein